MCKDKYVLIMDEDTQGLIINALLNLRDEKLKEGMDVGWMGDVIIEICNAPKKKERFLGDCHER